MGEAKEKAEQRGSEKWVENRALERVGGKFSRGKHNSWKAKSKNSGSPRDELRATVTEKRGASLSPFELLGSDQHLLVCGKNLARKISAVGGAGVFPAEIDARRTNNRIINNNNNNNNIWPCVVVTVAFGRRCPPTTLAIPPLWEARAKVIVSVCV